MGIELPWGTIAVAATAAVVITGLVWLRPWRIRIQRRPRHRKRRRQAVSQFPRWSIRRLSRTSSRCADEAAPSAAPAVAATLPVPDAEPVAGAGRARLRLSFSADSWVEVHDAAGKTVFAGKGLANSVKTLSGDAPLRVYLGFASGVQLAVNNRVVAIGPQFVAGDVARFNAGADGVLRRDTHAAASDAARRTLHDRTADRAPTWVKNIEPLRGVHDVLPAQAAAWQHLERVTREVFAGYGYDEFRVPVIEQTQLFKRSIGDFTDIVEKEMFSFIDQGEDHITLRPEATAGIVRAVISNGLLRDGRLRVWCMGPMFPARAAAGRALSSISSNRRGSVRFCRPRHRCRDDSAVRAAAAPIGTDAPQAALEFTRGLRRRARSTASSWRPISARMRISSTRTASGASRAIRCGFSTARTPTCSAWSQARRC